MNKYFEKWLIVEIEKTTGVFTARELVDKIIEERGSSPHIGDAYSATWVCKKHSKRIGRGRFVKEITQ
tara:strand:- start:7487 stop:7690 length:204 start_codon:yes stop_codon:yes gene_type:complete